VKIAIIGALAIAALTGCSKNIDNMEAVKQGVLRDIPKDINVGAMDVNVVSVSFRGQEADAVVSFAPKGGPAMMSMNYTMERKSNEWHIKKKANAQQHAAQGVPGGGGTAGPLPEGATQLPPGHPSTGAGQTAAPPISGGSTDLPPDHPPIGGARK